MKTLKISLFFVTMLLGISFAQAQTVDDIINKYIDAIGGKDKLSQINTLYTESVSEGIGKKMDIVTTIVNGKGLRTEMTIVDGAKNIVCSTETSGWIINGIGGDVEPLPLNVLKRQRDRMDILGPLFNYKTKGNKIVLLPSEKIGDVNAYKIVVTSSDSISKTTFYIDPTTYYVIEAISEAKVPDQEKDFVFTMSMSNYQKTDFGYIMPFTTEASFPGQGAITIKVKKVEVNKMVDPKIFDMPK